MKAIAAVQAEAGVADTERTVFLRTILEVGCPGCGHELDGEEDRRGMETCVQSGWTAGRCRTMN